MARPTRKTVDSGLEGWDAEMDDNFEVILDTPFPPALFANVAALPSAALYEGCIAWVEDEGILYVVHEDHWQPLAAVTHCDATEQDSGLRYTDDSIIYQKTVSLGALPNSTSANTAHGISGMDLLIKVEGGASAAAAWIPIPAPFEIEMTLTATNITIVTHSNYSTYTGTVTIFYTKT